MKVLILFGGNSSEHEVSVKSAKSILENIDYKKFKVSAVGIDKKNEWYVYEDETHLLNKNWLKRKIKKINNIISFIKTFDVVFPITHGCNGEDGKLQGFLDLFNIKYVGSKTLASAVGMDKEFSKIFFKHLNIPQVPYIVINNKYNTNQIEQEIKYPMIIKPANGGSSIGINKANNKKELIKAIKQAKKYDNKIIIEKFIKVRELECAILEDKELIISDIGEIKPCNEFYDYEAKYKQCSKTINKSELPNDIIKQIKEYAKKAFIGINAKGLSRIDFFYDEDNNKVYLNEINTLPGFTTISMYPTLITANTFSYTDLITLLIKNAFRC